MSTRLWLLVLGFVLGGFAVSAVQPISSDERTLRALVADVERGGEMPFAAAAVVWPAVFKRPVVWGEGSLELIEGFKSIESPSNSRSTFRIRKVEVAQSGDLAYEFSERTHNLQIRQPSGAMEAVVSTVSVLRVWKKVNGQWQQAAKFERTHHP